MLAVKISVAECLDSISKGGDRDGEAGAVTYKVDNLAQQVRRKAGRTRCWQRSPVARRQIDVRGDCQSSRDGLSR